MKLLTRTGAKAVERIPDHVVAEADQIVDVDITTEDLRRRLKAGRSIRKSALRPPWTIS